MTEITRFKINSPEVVQETIDGEVVIVNLKKGDYYSLLNTGTEIWLKIEQGLSQDKIIDFLCQKYIGDRHDIIIGVNNLIQELLKEKIIVFNNDNSNNAEINSPEIEEHIYEEKTPFEVPQLSKYTDMEELLALDPIHEVDEMGWPNARAEVEV